MSDSNDSLKFPDNFAEKVSEKSRQPSFQELEAEKYNNDPKNIKAGRRKSPFNGELLIPRSKKWREQRHKEEEKASEALFKNEIKPYIESLGLKGKKNKPR